MYIQLHILSRQKYMMNFINYREKYYQTQSYSPFLDEFIVWIFVVCQNITNVY